MQITGYTGLIAHIGWPTHTFRAPTIYNPYFQSAGIDVVVVPMGCRAESFAALLRSVFSLENIRGALITMPHKVSVVALCDEVTDVVKVAGSCNAVRRLPDGRLLGDMFDGEGFVRGLQGKGLGLRGMRALVVGAGGVGCAIAASLAAAGVAQLVLHDVNPSSAQALAARVRQHFPQVDVRVGPPDPVDQDLVVNATPLGMNAADPLPLDVTRLSAHTVVGEVVLKPDTPLLSAARARGCTVQVGEDMLFEMIPAYLDFFGLPTTTAQRLRELAQAAS